MQFTEMELFYEILFPFHQQRQKRTLSPLELQAMEFILKCAQSFEIDGVPAIDFLDLFIS